MSGCSSINIQSGPPTDEEATSESTELGRRVRADWTNRLRGVNSVQQTAIMRSFIDSTAARYIRYGLQVSDRWREENDRQGIEIPISEIRRMIDASTETEVPLFEAYEDVLEYGINLILEARYLEAETEDLLIEYREHYLEVYSAVFYPNGTRLDYEDRLYQLQRRSEDISLRLGEDLDKY
jgi:hypothetical protein